MAKNLTQNNINFTVNTTESTGGFATKRTNSNLISGGKYDVNLKQQLIDGNHESDWGGFSVNAVDIDWNGAEFPNTTPLAPSTINTTGDLINAIKWASAQGATYNNATTSSDGLMSSGDKIKLESIAPNANNYILQAATNDSLGGIKLGYTETGKKYAVKLSGDAAYVEVPWTTIDANIDTPNKKLTVSDSNNSEKFKIELTTDTNNSDVAVIKISSGNTNIQTAVPGITIDDRKLIWTNASGQESNKAITFGNFDIIYVTSVYPFQGVGRLGLSIILGNTSDPFYDPIYIGDLIVANSNTDSSLDPSYHLYICDESGYSESMSSGATFTAYFTDLGVFPGNNITLNAESILVDDINPGTNITYVQDALEKTLYYEVINSVEEEEDNTTTQDQGD